MSGTGMAGADEDTTWWYCPINREAKKVTEKYGGAHCAVARAVSAWSVYPQGSGRARRRTGEVTPQL